MRNLGQLDEDLDSLGQERGNIQLNIYKAQPTLFNYHFKDSVAMPPNLVALDRKRDSLRRLNSSAPDISQQYLRLPVAVDTTFEKSRKSVAAISDSIFRKPPTTPEISVALSNARNMKSQFTSYNANLSHATNEFRVFEVQWHNILASSFACIAMFLIGAPLGSIIKKGGLGVPVLVSIIFFILYYVFTLLGQKWAKQGFVSAAVGVWAADFILLLFGLVFLRQARRDARLFDADFYRVMWDKFKRWLEDRRVRRLKTT